MVIPACDNLAPDRFTFWTPPAGATVGTGADSVPVPLPAIPLPIAHGAVPEGHPPSDAAIGQGVYDYLRQFPDCVGNDRYAALLRDAYPHFLADLAAHAVMLAAKSVEPAYVARKLTCLKILALLEPRNRGLLWQLGSGYFDLALEFSELAGCRRHLREAMRFGQELLALDPAEPRALSLLAEVDLLCGDVPAARDKFRRLATLTDQPQERARIEERLAACGDYVHPTQTLVDELETVAAAMQLHAAGNDAEAARLLDRLATQGRLPVVLPSADFFALLGICRGAAGDRSGAVVALHQALELEPDHAAARSALDFLRE